LILVGLGFATFLVGMVAIFPLLGHAPWHAYRDLFKYAARSVQPALRFVRAGCIAPSGRFCLRQLDLTPILP
jgi:hypothetical protein